MVDAVLKQEPVPEPDGPENEDPMHNHYSSYQQGQRETVDIIEPSEINLEDVFKNVHLPQTGATYGASAVGAMEVHEVRVTRSSTQQSAIDVPHSHDVGAKQGRSLDQVYTSNFHVFSYNNRD